MRVKTPPPTTRACEVCYTPIPIALVADRKHPRCAKHVDWQPPVLTLRPCPSCGQPTFREGEVCTRCDPAVPELRARKVSNRRERRKPKVAQPLRKRAAIVVAKQEPPRPSGELLDPDEPHLDRRAAHAIGNRCSPGRSVAKQTPARDKALALMQVPDSWEVLARYQSPVRVKAATWYLRHHVLPTLPPGRWEFKRCWWERAAVMGRYRPPLKTS